MSGWSRLEVEAIINDYLSMLSFEIAGIPYSKTVHRRKLIPLLAGRSEASIEFKHCNISAALVDLGFPYINRYKPRFNYQNNLTEVVAEKLLATQTLLDIAAADADCPMIVPEVENILKVLTDPPEPYSPKNTITESVPSQQLSSINYTEREARNQSLGLAGEEFVLNFEKARLIHAGHEKFASKIEHTSKVRGDREGYDILSFEDSGAERFIEVKTTKYGKETPFFVSRNEMNVSEKKASQYQVYRLFDFRVNPRLYVLPGAISTTCHLLPSIFLARPNQPTSKDG